MAHTVCHDVGNWVESNVQQQVERCIEQDCNWWCACCNKWFCFLVWVVVTIVTWVVTTVCEVVADAVDLIINVVKGLIDIFVGIFTLDWSRILAGLGEIVGGLLKFVFDLVPIVTLGTLVGAFETSWNAWRLREFARDLLERKYKEKDPEGFRRMEDALGLNSGGFGLRLSARVMRSVIQSDLRTNAGGAPDLVTWAQQGLDLKGIAGFNPPLWWQRTWPELDPSDLTESDIDAYLANGGSGDGVRQFSIFSMSRGDLDSRLDCADQHASEIGLVFKWTVENTPVREREQVVVNRGAFANLLTHAPFSRHNRNPDAAAASAELGVPFVIGGFDFTEAGAMGISAHLASCTCLEADSSGSTAFPGEGITGVDFRYRKPDDAFKYTAMHEIGHTFGLCHVDGLLRIMFTRNDLEDKSIWSGSSVWQYWTTGLEAGFTLDEGKKVWQYIVENFDAAILETRPF